MPRINLNNIDLEEELPKPIKQKIKRRKEREESKEKLANNKQKR